MNSILGSGPFKTSLDRRTFLRGAATVGGITLVAGTLAACAPTASSSKSGDKSNTLTIMIPALVDPSFIKRIFTVAAAGSIGAKLKVVIVDSATFPQLAAAAQKAGNPPDLLYYTAQGIPVVQAAGVSLLPLDDYAKKEVKSEFYQQDYDANTVNGKIYGLGVYAGSRGLVYRSDYAKSAGLTIPEHWTFDEFGEMAAKLNADSHVGFGFEAKTGDGRSSSNFLPLIWSTGSDFVTGGPGKWKIGPSADQFEKVMQFYHDTVHLWHSTPAEVGNWGYPDTDGNYSQGRLASYGAGPFVVPNSAKFPKTIANTDVTTAPNGGTPTSFWEEWTLMIHEDAPNKDLAWSFVEALRSAKTQKLLAGHQSDALLSIRKSVNKDIENPLLRKFGSLLTIAKVPEAINIQPLMDNSILPAIQSVALTNIEPKAAADKIMTTMQTQIDLINQA
jgi:N,N'-diacetylchitobiose transport system substrate-binding protein